MKKALITGSAGFIGTHLANEFRANSYEVIRCDLQETADIISMDIMKPEKIREVLSKYEPDVLINMAGQANVGLSWQKPQLTLELNTIGLVNILEAVRAVKPVTRVITIGSSDEYGALGNSGINVTEETPVNPITPYAISKHSQELFAQLYHKVYGLDICMLRLFNLGGAGQAKGYIISDFSSGIAEIEAGKKDYLSVGNLNSARDFTHVKDACRAIRLVAEKGHSGEIYNISSGVTHTVQELLDVLVSMAKVRIEVKHDPTRMRPSDTPVVCGNHEKLTKHTGWEAEYTFNEILKDALEYWRNHA